MSAGFSFAQLLDDSTRQVYGTHSVRYQLEDGVYANDSSWKSLDTSLYDVQVFNYTYGEDGPRQELGGLGSPSQPMFPSFRDDLGVQLGVTSTSYQAFHNDEIQYFDTKSPYSELSYFQNFRGQEYFDGLFTRSAEDRLNFGLRFSRIGSDRQLGANPSGDKFVDTYRALGYIKLKGLKGKYELLANARYYDYDLFENGGVYSTQNGNVEDSLFGNFIQVNLSGVRSQDRRMNYHLYHHFSLDSSESIQFFHTYDRKRRRSIYTDADVDAVRIETNNSSNASFYPVSFVDTLPIVDSTFFTVHQNVAGIKGSLFDAFYSGYVKLRQFSYERTVDSVDYDLLKGDELYFGGEFRRTLFDKATIRFSAEGSSDGYFLSKNSITHERFNVGLNYNVLPPSAMVTLTNNNHFSWVNAFENQQDLEFVASYNNQFGALDLELSGKFLRNTNLIYFDNTGTPDQLLGDVATTVGGIKVKYKLGKWLLRNEVWFGATSNDYVVRMPKVFNRFQFIYQTTPKRSHYKVLLGADVWSRSSYFGNAYMPYIQQFHLQDSFELKAYTWADVFVTLEVKSARIFLKMPHVTQGLLSKGYFSTPFYYGSQRVLELGFNWKFYD